MTERAHGPSMAAVSGFLLELYEASNELGYRQLQERALLRLGAVVRHDRGLLAVGTHERGEVRAHDLLPVGLPRDAFLADWERVKHEDRITRWSARHPGKTGNFAVAALPLDPTTAGIRAHCARFGIAHTLVTSVEARGAEGLYWTLLLYRGDALDPFTEEERAAVEVTTPHVFAAARRARLRELRAGALVPAVHGQVAAVVSPVGLVVEADPGFSEMLRLGWPTWRGPLLPSELVDELPGAAETHRILREHVVVRVHPTDGGWLLHLRRPIAADALTSRERQLAEAFAGGASHRELAEALGLSPNTVRRHLANVYEKLGISSKAELDRMVQEEG